MADVNHAGPSNYPYLSSPFHSMKPEYDVVVIGSGYGAGVAASRMARAGKKVAVLELGWERRPGSFPHTLQQCVRDMNVSGTFRKNPLVEILLSSNKPTRLFQLMLGEGQHAFRAHGLGGCSLINAGVFLEADTATLQMNPWPADIRKDPLNLRPYYSRAVEMLQPSTYPETYPRLSKTDHLQGQSNMLGRTGRFYKVPLTMFFENRQNHAGVTMHANTRTGHECTGLNDGSKNSVPTSYLTDAWNWGAEIFCGCEVRHVDKMADDTGYSVYFAWHGGGRSVFQEEFKHQLFWVRAKEFCFLGAGALGSTEILLRSKRYGLSVSPMLGRNLSGNGDMLLFGYDGETNVNGLSGGFAKPGPTITAIIDNRGQEASKDPLAGYVIQDGCIPEPFSPLIQLMLIMQTVGSYTASFFLCLGGFFLTFLASLKSLFVSPRFSRGTIQRTATYLVMSHDTNELTLTLENDKPLLRGPAESHSYHAVGIRKALDRAIRRTGAKTGFSYFFGFHQDEVTVHPLGGANMSRNGRGREGVTSSLGEVYMGHDDSLHQGLICCDGSVVPTSLGVNPLATITALAERSLDLLSQKYGFAIDLETVNGPLDSNSQPRVSRSARTNGPRMPYVSIGWQFTEILHGHICISPGTADFAVSESLGKGRCCAIRMYLTVEIQRSVHGAHQKPRYRGKCSGTVSCAALSHNTLRIIDGMVEFFTPSTVEADGVTITYALRLLSQEGVEYTLKGTKEISSGISFSIKKTWDAATTVNVEITRNDDIGITSGIVRISLASFQRQLQTFRTTTGIDLKLILPLALFLVYFALQICVFFFRPFTRSVRPRSSKIRDIRARRTPSEVLKLITSDGVEVLLDVYEPQHMRNSPSEIQDTDAQPVLFLPGVTGVHVEHSIFTLPFQRCNMMEYFSNRGCRCYVLTPRWGCNVKDAEKCTVYDVRLDIMGALACISSRESKKPYIIAHCQGSVALAMGLLDGSIPSTGVQGVTANSVFMSQVFGYWNAVKAASPTLIRVHEYLGGSYFPITDGSSYYANSASSSTNSLFQRALDAILHLYPVRDSGEICTSSACHRTSFAFGQLWNHRNLDPTIHDNIHRFFTGTHTRVLEHVTRMGKAGQCLTQELRPLISERNLENLRGLPILLVSGTENEVFNPESTLKDYELLRRKFSAGDGMYRRFMVEGYGHLDPIVGRDAADDVYWRVYGHLQDSVAASET